jgi:poly-gamma-glutamate capsule biosynthesis protein CapA/YwtB (metallophosphatase superfamily)
LSATTDPIAT